MLSRKLKLPLLCLLIIGTAASAETLIEKEKNGKDLTAIELTAIAMAEVKDCEDRVPGFKSQADKFIAQFKNHPKYKEIESSPDFKKLEPDAANFVSDRRRGSSIKHQCELTLAYYKKQKF